MKFSRQEAAAIGRLIFNRQPPSAAASLYAKLGWKPIERVQADNRIELLLMVKDLALAEGTP